MTIPVRTSITSYSKADRFVHWLSRHWVLVFGLLFGMYVLAPLMAPAFMAAGLAFPGRVIYFVYSFLCHQLPERSYFLFGPKISYSLSEIKTVWHETDNILILRQFIGNPQMGWKVAWSDRMVSMFTSLWLFGIVWGMIRKKIKPLPWWGLALFLLPMAVDGLTHSASDLAGIGRGFRDTNTWLAVLTNHQFATTFYIGDAWGSFNSWMRVITGIFFGMGIVWFGFPYLDSAFTNSVAQVEYKYKYQAWLQNNKERQIKLTPVGISQPNGSEIVLRNGKGNDYGDRT